MAVTTSYITDATTNTLDAVNKWSAQDGSLNSDPGTALVSDFEMTFGNLSVPAGATITGLRLIVHGQGNSGTAPTLFFNNGTSDGDAVACDGSWTKSNVTRNYGTTSSLHGLSWNATTAAAVTVRIDFSTMPGGSRFYWDSCQMEVYYEEGIESQGLLTLDAGLVTISSGKITL